MKRVMGCVMRRAWEFAIASCALWATTALAAEVRLPVPEIETLPNGLRLAWFVNDSLPVVDLVLLVQSGNRDDAPGRSGTAELLGSLLDRGNAGMSAQALARAVEMLGASRYSSADEDVFSVGMHGLAPDALTLLDLLSKMALKPDFPEAEVKREHARLLDRWNHVADYGDALATVAFRRLVTAGTTYSRGGFASAREFGAVGRRDVAEFHRKHFTPKNSVLMVVGRVDKPEFRKQILERFGDPTQWSGEAPRRDWRKYVDKRIPRKKASVVLVDRPGLTQAEVRIGFQAPPLQSPRRYALGVANALLGEYFNSRLNALIRDKLGLTYGIASAFAYNRDFASFTITSATRNEAVGDLIKRTVDVLNDLKKGPIPAEEVKMAKEYLVGGFPLSVSTLGAVASRWLTGYAYGLGPEYLNEFVPKVAAVTTEQVVAAVVKDFRLEDLVITVAGDAKEIGKSLAGGKFPVVRLEAKQLM